MYTHTPKTASNSPRKEHSKANTECLRFEEASPRLCLRISDCFLKWDFPKIRGTLSWGPYNKDPTIKGTVSGSPIFGNPQMCVLLLKAPCSTDLVSETLMRT